MKGAHDYATRVDGLRVSIKAVIVGDDNVLRMQFLMQTNGRHILTGLNTCSPLPLCKDNVNNVQVDFNMYGFAVNVATYVGLW